MDQGKWSGRKVMKGGKKEDSRREKEEDDGNAEQIRGAKQGNQTVNFNMLTASKNKRSRQEREAKK